MRPVLTPEYRFFLDAQKRCARYGWGFGFECFGDSLRVLGKPPTLIHVLVRLDRKRPYEPGNVAWVLLTDKPEKPPQPLKPKPPLPYMADPWVMSPGTWSHEGSREVRDVAGNKTFSWS
ncbi:MAG TPA: hypothetical protein VHZ55_27865 [Bryobacteraceae bacterium]|nr:hypothetical protein [Bryobacteraceae bacterium]